MVLQCCFVSDIVRVSEIIPETISHRDLKIMNNGDINIYVKDTSSGLYINYNSYEQWHTKTAWVRALYDRAHKICSNDNLFQKQVAGIKKVMSWNGYPRYIRNKIIKRL